MVSGSRGGILVRSPRRWRGQCGLTTARLAARRGRGDRGVQGGARGMVWQTVVHWRASASSLERAAAMAARFSASGVSTKGKRRAEMERQRSHAGIVTPCGNFP
jgi:hypothetical protein